MKTDFFTKTFRNMKIVQMIFVALIEIFCLLLLILHSGLRKLIFENTVLTLVFFIIWGFFLLSLFFLYYDFHKLYQLAAENHTLSQLAYLDTLTGIPNRYSLDLIFRIFGTPDSVRDICCMVIQITNLKTINDTISHEAGDKLIQDFCSIFETVGDRFGYLGRNGGNEFVIVIENCPSEKADNFLKTLHQRLDLYNQENTETPICITVASVLNSEAQTTSFKDLLTLTYEKLQNI